jgi:peroxiredoxin
MKKSISILLVLVCFVFSQPILAIEFQAFNGYKTSLNEQIGKGKWSIVVFWSHSCTICLREIPALNAFYTKHKNSDARVIGVSIDGQKNQPKAEFFIRQTQMIFPAFISEFPMLALQFEEHTGTAFRGTPTFLLYNPKAELVGLQAGPVSMQALEDFISGKNN